MRAVITIALLLIVGQAIAAQVEQVISVQHDSQRGVTCWILNDSAISCLPDSQIQKTLNVTPDHIKSGPTPAATPVPDQHEERFQL